MVWYLTTSTTERKATAILPVVMAVGNAVEAQEGMVGTETSFTPQTKGLMKERDIVLATWKSVRMMDGKQTIEDITTITIIIAEDKEDFTRFCSSAE